MTNGRSMKEGSKVINRDWINNLTYTQRELGIEIVQHSALSPDLAPCDVWLFPILKSELRGRGFYDNNDMSTVAREIIRKILKEHFRACFDKWVRR